MKQVVSWSLMAVLFSALTGCVASQGPVDQTNAMNLMNQSSTPGMDYMFRSPPKTYTGR